MSQRSFSILALPMIFSKNVFSILWALPKRKLASSMSRRPNLVVLLGELDSMWLRSIAKAWSCKFSTWEVSFKPAVSAILHDSKDIHRHEIWLRSNLTLCTGVFLQISRIQSRYLVPWLALPTFITKNLFCIFYDNSDLKYCYKQICRRACKNRRNYTTMQLVEIRWANQKHKSTYLFQISLFLRELYHFYKKLQDILSNNLYLYYVYLLFSRIKVRKNIAVAYADAQM